MIVENQEKEGGVFQPIKFSYNYEGKGFVADKDATILDAVTLLNLQHSRISSLKDEIDFLKKLILVMAGKNDQ